MTSEPAANPNGNAEHSRLDENTPLLTRSDAVPVTAAVNDEEIVAHERAQNNDSDDEDEPLPKVQIFLLCYARLVEPIVFFSIFPFVNQMIQETGNIDTADVGFYAGVIESSFSLVQMVLMIPWGRVADRWGRKPVLVSSLCGMSIATALFGLSKTIWQMVLIRCINGIFGGTVVAVRSMISENSTPKTQARAFSFFSFASNMGIFLGPLLGGTLADPVGQYPNVFGHVQFFKKYPYFLSTFTVGALSASACIINAIFLKETLNVKKGPNTPENEPTSTWKIVKYPGVSNVLYLYTHIMVLAFGYTAVAPIFWFTPPHLGGFGFSFLRISIFMAVGGFSQAVWLLVFFPPLQHRFGTVGVLYLCAWAWPIFFFFNPLCNIFLRLGWKAPFWAVAPTGLIIGSGVAMAFTAIQLALNDISPSPSTLGTLNAVSLTLTSGIRAITPALFASIFAAGVNIGFLYGHLAWIVLIVIALGLVVALRWLPEKAAGRLSKKNQKKTPNRSSGGEENGDVEVGS